MAVLVVGGNGQLGAACCAELVAHDVEVRASVRDRSRGAGLARLGVDVLRLDVTHGRDERAAALRGVETLVLSANAVAARAGDRPADVEEGLSALVTDALEAGVRVVLPSVPVTAVDEQVPTIAAKRALERLLAGATNGSWVLRLPPFFESWFVLVGSSVPLRGEPYATIGRDSPFLRRFRAFSGSLVETRGLMLVPGSPDHRNAFISVRDAARACAVAATRGAGTPSPVEVAGPQILTWREVADLFARMLGRRVRVLSTPAPVYAAAAGLLRPLADVPSRTMALNRYVASSETPWTTAGGGLVAPDSMLTAEAFLGAKAALSDELPAVP
jgi:uncharacterized protein YbjT (DUF2867 family)